MPKTSQSAKAKPEKLKVKDATATAETHDGHRFVAQGNNDNHAMTRLRKMLVDEGIDPDEVDTFETLANGVEVQITGKLKNLD